MFLAEKIIQNFVEGIDEEDFVTIESLNDEEAFKYICGLYEKNYGIPPSGVGIYLLRTKFKLGSEQSNKKYIPNNLLQ
jgi:hypothetical protein